MDNVLSCLTVAMIAVAAVVGLWRMVVQPAAAAQMMPLPSTKKQWRVAVGVALWGIVMLCVLLCYAAAKEPGTPLLAAYEDWFGANNDTENYMRIARWGYCSWERDIPDQPVMIAFFPLYPLLLRVFWHFHLNIYLVGSILNLGFVSAGAVLFYRTVCRIAGERAALWAVLLQFAMPGSFFFVIPQTEALFFFLGFAFLDCMQGEQWFSAGMLGFLAALCRAHGVLLAGFAMVTFFLALRNHKKPRVRWLAPMLFPFGGFITYLLVNLAVYGNAFQFQTVQQEHWGNGFAFFGKTVHYLCSYVNGSEQGIFLSLWSLAVIVAEAVILVFACRKLPVPWLMLGLAAFVLSNGQSWIISAQRYALGIQALVPAMVVGIARKDWQRGVALGILLCLWGIYFAAFLRRCYIY